jgi:hypothetical protein
MIDGKKTYVINAAARVIQKSAMKRSVPPMPDARRETGARRAVKNARTSKKRANK